MSAALSREELNQVRACRRALLAAGWQLAETNTHIGCLCVRASRRRKDAPDDEELIVLSHPGGPVRTYTLACSAAGVTPDLSIFEEGGACSPT